MSDLAREFHDAYERLAPAYGYTTRQDTREFDPDSPNGKLMTAVCSEVLGGMEAEAERLRAKAVERERVWAEHVARRECASADNERATVEWAKRNMHGLEAEIERLQARERELEARLRMAQSVLWDDDGDDLGCVTVWREALLRSRELMDAAALAAVSAETEDET